MKQLHFYALILFGSLLTFGLDSCKKDDIDPILESIQAVKNDQWRSRIGEEVEIEGYIVFNNDGSAVMLASRDDYYQNGTIDENRYVALGSENIRLLDRPAYFMDRVKLKGRIRATTDVDRIPKAGLFGDLSQFEIEPTGAPTLIENYSGIVVDFVNPCVANPALCQLMNTTDTDKYALLYSGGVNKDAAYQRYWNDMALYYNMLIWINGFDPDNIIVVYKNGLAENNDMPVHYAATINGLASAFDDLESMMDNNDKFFLFMTNHGGTLTDDNSPATDDEDFGLDNVDECSYYYNVNRVIYDEEFAAMVNSLPFASMICVMEQCFSGGFIYDLRGPNRVIISAANEVEVSYGGAKYDDFVMLFASAIIGTQQETGASIDADTNNDGEVSVQEAYIYARNADPYEEHPQYEDNGDGQPVALPNNGGTIDGLYGSNVFL
jgi:hypothetical protein